MPIMFYQHVLKPGTPEHSGTLEHQNTRTPRNTGTSRNTGTAEKPWNSEFDGVVLFSQYRPCKKCKCKFVYPRTTKELRARYKVHVYEIQLELRSVAFCGGRKTGEPGEKQTTNSPFIWQWVRGANPGHIGGRRVPFNHCSSPYVIIVLRILK